MIAKPTELIPALDQLGYIIDEELATVIYLTLKLEKPLLLEGHPGVGKTEIARILSKLFDTDMIRLQCYEGLDVHNSIYEWNYQKQLLSIKLQEQSDLSVAEKESLIFSKDYLLERPLLRAITADQQVVLLIDEIDRADEEFEAYLLELLSDFQISIPEIGTIKARHKPIVVLTSNRTRELSDALRRRCLYHWVPYPTPEKEVKILQKHIPQLEHNLARNIAEHVQKMRQLDLDKTPGIAETIDWAKGILALGNDLSDQTIEQSLSCILKSASDIKTVKQSIAKTA